MFNYLKKTVYFSVILFLFLFLTSCTSESENDLLLPIQGTISETIATNESSFANEGTKDYSQNITLGWSKEAVTTEMFQQQLYSIVYSQIIDTYLIACGLYYDFNMQNQFSPQVNIDYNETIEHFSPFKDHDFIQTLEPYIDESSMGISSDVLYHLVYYITSMKNQGEGLIDINSNIFLSEQEFNIFLEDLLKFYNDTNASSFFTDSKIHLELENYIKNEIVSVPVVEYLTEVEKYTGTKEIIFSDKTLHSISLLSIYNTPFNASFHEYKIDNEVYLLSVQSPFGFDGNHDIKQMVETTVHETLHMFINPGVVGQNDLILELSGDKNTQDFTCPMYYYFPWHRIVDEAVVRVVQARIYGIIDKNFEKSAMQLLDKETRSGIVNLDLMYDSLEVYEQNRSEYHTIDDFLSNLISIYLEG